MEEKTENPLEIENLKQIISLDFQNLKEIVNGMAKSLLAFTQAKIDISKKKLKYDQKQIKFSHKNNC